jgi:hypothetical protein
VIQVFLCVPNAPLNIVVKMDIGLSPVQTIVTIAHTTRAASIATILMIHASLADISVLFTIWYRGSLILLLAII